MKNVYKKISFFLVFTLMIQLVPSSAIKVKAATSGTCGDNVTWSLDGTTLTISGSGAMTNYTYLNAVPWYSSSSKITQVTIASGITGIGDYAFCDCSSLTSVTIPNTVTRVGKYAFQNCVSLTSITIPNSVTSIDNGAFYGNSLLSKVSMGTGLKTIGSSAFFNAKSLTSITLGSNVTTIGNAAFYGNSVLTSITFNSKLTTIEKNAFMHCSSLASVSLPSSVTTIGVAAFSYTRLSSFTIPSGVTSMEGNPFVGCSRLSTITVASGNSKFKMDNDILYELSGTTPYAVVCLLPASTKTSLSVNSGTKIIYEHGFSFAYYFTSIALPDTLTTIEQDAFFQCDVLKTLTIPDSVTTVSEGAFTYLPSLTSVSLGSGFPSAVNVFFGCTSLANISVANSNPNIIVKDNVVYNTSKTTLQYYAPAHTATEYHMEDTTLVIATNAIYGTTYLKDLYIPATLTNIDYQGIYSNQSLNSIFFEGNAPEYYYNSLKPITTSLDNMLIYITEDATDWDGDYWSKWNYNFVYWDPSNTTVYNGTIDDVSWKVEEGIGRITLTGENAALSDFASVEDTPWYRSYDLLQTIEMKGITSLGSYTFTGTKKMIRVEADSNLTSIGDYTFQNCSTLKYFDDMDILTSIGTAAFAGNTSLQEKICFQGISSLGQEAFQNCESLSSMYFGNKLTKILTNTFEGCISLKHVILPETLTQIQTSAFADCSSLRTINIPAAVTLIGASAFAQTDSLENVYFYGKIPSSWQADSFSDSNANLTLYYRANETENASSWETLNGSWNSIPVVGVERFYTEGQDYYSFTNSASSFGYNSSYRIPVERYREVLDIIKAHYYYAVNRSWGGNCFGMSSTSLAFYEEDTALSDYAENIETLYEMEAPKDATSDLTKLIETYQISQFHPNIAGTRGDINTYFGDYRNIVYLVEEFERSGGFRIDSQATPVVLGLYSLFGAHAVVPTSVEQDDNGDYILTIYDSNHPTQLQTMKIYKDFSGINYLWYTAASCITYSTIADIFNSPSSRQTTTDSSLYLSIDKEQGTVETTTSTGEIQKNGDIEGGYEQKIFSDNSETETEETFSGIRSFVMPAGNYKMYDNSDQENSVDSEEDTATFYLASTEHFAEIETSDEDAQLAVSGSAVSDEPLILSLDSDEETITSEFSIMNEEGDVSEIEIVDTTATIQLDDSIEIQIDNTENGEVKVNGTSLTLTEDGRADIGFKEEEEITPTPSPSPTPSTTPTVTPTSTPTSSPTIAPTEVPTTPTPDASIAPALKETLEPISSDVYDANSAILNQNTKVKWQGNSIKVNWTAIEGADGYDIELTNTKKKDIVSLTNIESGDKTSATLTKHDEKKLDSKSIYQISVKAYRQNGEKKDYLAESTDFYIVGNKHKKYTNVKKLKPKKKKLTLKLKKKKKKAKLAITIVKQKKKKKLLPKSYGPTLTYISSNTKIATVTKKGVVKAKKKGSCYIYVRGLNGVSCKVKITVKKV